MAVDFLYDYASPYSFLANETLATKLPGVDIEYRPVYLRGFEAFKTGMPYTGPKLSWLIVDLRRCASELGIELRVPTAFPINGLYALRGAIAAQRSGKFAAYHQAMFRAAWQLGRDISRKESVAALATELGLPEVAALLDEPSIKDELKANTDDAIRRGAFGVPTFYVGPELFWGHDRMHQVARAIGAGASGG